MKETEENLYLARIKAAREKVNAVSPSFCIAKWKQVTLHLQNGHTHSCHHPNTHVVSLDQLRSNPTALHNTDFKKAQRKLMLEGVRPPECSYCWRAEDSGNQYSDRIYKSSEAWALPHLESIVNSNWDDNVDPSYVEVSFSNVCNFKCSYCSPNISSKWMEEIKQFGPYPTSLKFNNLDWIQQQEKMPIPEREDNPYVDAFWEWWPKMYTELKHFRITGGEPLLSKHTFKVLDYVIANPNPNLILSINTNLNPPDELFNKFIEKLQIIQNEKKVKGIEIFTSAEAHGAQAEYIRNGMDYNMWLFNLERILKEVPKAAVTIMSTYNILSVPTYQAFLQDMLNIRRKYIAQAKQNHRMPVIVDMPYLNHPEHQAAFIIPQELLHFVEEQIKFMKDNREVGTPGMEYLGFYDHEIYKLERIYNILVTELESPRADLNVRRKDFVLFVDEHDRRRGTNFLETYPEFKEMYFQWKAIS
jgi:organic radical activating enzyme